MQLTQPEMQSSDVYKRQDQEMSVFMIGVMVSRGISNILIWFRAVSCASRKMPSAWPPSPESVVSVMEPLRSTPMQRIGFTAVFLQ